MYLDKCCCCAELRTGALILGWLGLIGAVIGCFSVPSDRSQYESLAGKLDRDTITRIESSVYWSTISNNVVSIGVNISLLYGAYKNNRMFILPWLIMGGIGIVVVTLLVLVLSILCFVYEIAAVGGIILGIGALYLAFAVYIYCCVLSFFQLLREEEKRTARSQPEELGFIPPMQGGTAPQETKSAYKPY